ncbi:MAG: haloacid dehalogenase-like hydrolase, partial [Oscillospiraceae bacterium]
SKTQFLYRINKGVFEVTDSDGLNEFMPEEKRRVPFRNMVYIGDGYTDVPCMRVMRTNGGHAIAVFSDDMDRMSELVLKGRADYAVRTDYSAGSDMEKTVFALIDLVAAENVTAKLRAQSNALAKRQAEEKRRREWETQRGKAGEAKK